MRQRIIHRTLMFFISMMMASGVNAQMKHNPKFIVRRAMNQLEKGKGDSLQAIITIATYIGHEKVKKKLRNKATESVESAYQAVINRTDSQRQVLSRCVQLDQSITPYKRYLCLNQLLSIIQKRITLAEAVRKAEEYFSITPSNLDELQADYSQHEKLLDMVKNSAASYKYEQGDSLINGGDSSKASYRQAYREFAICQQIDAHYLDVSTRVQQCIDSGTVIIRFAPVTSESGNLNLRAAKLLEQDVKISMLNIKHPFIKVVFGDESVDADVTFYLDVISTTVEYTKPPSQTFQYEKTITVDGKPKKVHATITENYQDVVANVIGSLRVVDHSGELSLNDDPVKVQGYHHWSDAWGVLSGDSRALPKRSRFRVRKPKQKPSKDQIIKLAVQDIWDGEISSLLDMIQKAL